MQGSIIFICLKFAIRSKPLQQDVINLRKKRNSSRSIVCMGKIAACVILNNLMNGYATPLTHEWISIFFNVFNPWFKKKSTTQWCSTRWQYIAVTNVKELNKSLSFHDISQTTQKHPFKLPPKTLKAEMKSKDNWLTMIQLFFSKYVFVFFLRTKQNIYIYIVGGPNFVS